MRRGERTDVEERLVALVAHDDIATLPEVVQRLAYRQAQRWPVPGVVQQRDVTARAGDRVQPRAHLLDGQRQPGGNGPSRSLEHDARVLRPPQQVAVIGSTALLVSPVRQQL